MVGAGHAALTAVLTPYFEVWPNFDIISNLCLYTTACHDMMTIQGMHYSFLKRAVLCLRH